LEVGATTVNDTKPLKKGQIEKDGLIYEAMHNNLFSFAFTVNRGLDEIVSKPQIVAYIPTNETIPFEEEDEDPENVSEELISLWYFYFLTQYLRSRIGFFRSEVQSIPIQVARELSRPFFWHLYHRVARRKLRSYIFLVKSIAQILRCVVLCAKLILFLDTLKKR
jgi:hypothetical protein